jgi:serine/threonine-protein kinase PRP4
MLGSFDYKNHLCIVFEAMQYFSIFRFDMFSMNLRELLRKYGREVGVSVNAVRSYAKQMLISLKHLQVCGVIHGDIKPDNILVSDKLNLIKLCDFGTADWAREVCITPYIVSRYYRAPEISEYMCFLALIVQFSE